MKPAFLLVAFAVLAATSCQTVWDRYDESLYVSVFEPSAETQEAHIATLESLASQEPPPPGICAELGYYLALVGREGEAQAWLDRELKYWPESSEVVTALHTLIDESGEGSPLDSNEEETE